MTLSTPLQRRTTTTILTIYTSTTAPPHGSHIRFAHARSSETFSTTLSLLYLQPTYYWNRRPAPNCLLCTSVCFYAHARSSATFWTKLHYFIYNPRITVIEDLRQIVCYVPQRAFMRMLDLLRLSGLRCHCFIYNPRTTGIEDLRQIVCYVPQCASIRM
ncbi:hypothetical protein AVEN_161416-1 [Araneus ventricosus]|uniref:Uncharacterized protein n=1 Tax=Araneus ventricosus TaxID=182803 RepID=A0A4Y2K067_ARAVE|nr:hypothetical protein AVEN_161416-1 [Araneus ventricosus]